VLLIAWNCSVRLTFHESLPIAAALPFTKETP
jgi:hypothetical protein